MRSRYIDVHVWTLILKPPSIMDTCSTMRPQLLGAFRRPFPHSDYLHKGTYIHTSFSSVTCSSGGNFGVRIHSKRCPFPSACKPVHPGIPSLPASRALIRGWRGKCYYGIGIVTARSIIVHTSMLGRGGGGRFQVPMLPRLPRDYDLSLARAESHPNVTKRTLETRLDACK